MSVQVDSTSSPGVTTEGLSRAEGLWFEDCGFIIQAEMTLFRVSRDILAIQSPIFRDLFSLPAPKETDMMDGCPFVLLQDLAQDVDSVLRAIFYYDFFGPYPAPTTWAVLAGILRMAHKYEIEGLRKRAITHISSIHPTSLDQWDKLDDNPSAWFTEAQSELLQIVILAQSLSLDWILPTAFYRVCEYTWERQILSAQIAFDDKARLITACRVLESSAVTKVLSFLWPLDEREKCTTARYKARKDVEARRERSGESTANVPLDVWKEEDWDNLNVCAICLVNMKAAHQASRRALWDELPAMFGLQNWNELEEMRAKAME
ncbi:hypothetical protein B0H16DRAFT_1571596 [Mycena metata]|uniref:BTB domain-containing protein n=1 Tax=Mycena metata TaxID=1033252 RepID=A0AAD7MY79_9AGAR|nr:hypothetical protein B0H16DRAFT_1571596 [Mycena metata]